jgi:Kef-type K+ transport system membrane component KefB
LFIAIALTFSSTIIIVKLLSDKNDLDKLYGKISMGFLIVQDFVAVFILMIISSLMNLDVNKNIYIELGKTFFIGIFSIIFVYLVSKYVMPKLLSKIAKYSELLFIFIVTWCFGLAALFSYFGFSLEIGALLAGIALASSNYHYEISSKVKPLRDFFIVMFFLLLGAQMFPAIPGIEQMGVLERLTSIYDIFGNLIIPAILFSVFVLVGNPLIVMFLMSTFKYSTKNGFLAGLTVAQISEFSLILIMMAFNAGFVNSSEVVMVTFIGIITILMSTYMIYNGDRLYSLLRRFLVVFEPKEIKKNYKDVESDNLEVLIFGYDRIGYSLLKAIKKKHKNFAIVDYNPEVIEKLNKINIDAIYGDASDVDLLEEFHPRKLKLIVSTIPDLEVNSLILGHFAKKSKELAIILTANQNDEAIELYENGADYVITPHLLGGHYVSTLVEEYDGNYENFLKEKITHINELKERKGS